MVKETFLFRIYEILYGEVVRGSTHSNQRSATNL